MNNSHASRLNTLLLSLSVVSGCVQQSTVQGADSEQINTGPTDAGLVQKQNLQYQGSFRLPPGPTDAQSFEYGGTAIGYNPANNTLFITGHDHHQLSAEVNIPTPSPVGDLGALPVAEIVQPLGDALNGQLGAINPSDPNSKKIGGHLVYNGRLIMTGWSFYDGAGTASASHFVRPMQLSADGLQGPYRVGDQNPGFVNGYMTTIPQEWRGAFGGPALTGMGGAGIASVQSNGPAASVFNPDDVGRVNPVPATPVVGYPLTQSLARQYGANESSGANPYFNLTSQIRGVVFPNNTRSVLFFGRHGIGEYCYGDPGPCGDPADSGKGTHAYPYVYQVWAYDANDLLAVKNGQKAQYEIKPYSIWRFNVPFEQDDIHTIGGAAYDSNTGRIFVITHHWTGSSQTPVVSVYKVSTTET